ncbi:hypothetical protein [Alkaliphilus oremlandii]|uniref:Uncharacterized protein n=1 Tax=Alkaliphilus oremlandii (strain OhILAs) TaxID=350688 RepID=A8MHT2_ALKOO|nr:hypothetical protein [Alkaliphilus oremlandii]ABW19364.1 hypothetical protein Clos_1824 [Alkaliphilus oremlandii OhILAs]
MAVPFEAIADGLSSIVSRITSIRNLIRDFWDDISYNFTSIINYLNPFSDKFFLWIALIPQDGFFESFFNDILGAFNERLPLIGQIRAFMENIKGINYSQELPKFEITMPSKYGGGQFSIVDFSYFVQYRVYILNFIRFSAWFFFIKRLWKTLPLIIYK